jgi:hypothetical protein
MFPIQDKRYNQTNSIYALDIPLRKISYRYCTENGKVKAVIGGTDVIVTTLIARVFSNRKLCLFVCIKNAFWSWERPLPSTYLCYNENGGVLFLTVFFSIPTDGFPFRGGLESSVDSYFGGVFPK